MSDKLISISLAEFDNINVPSICVSTENLFNLALESIHNNTLKEAKELVDDFTCCYESIYEHLKIKEDQYKESIYYFGQMKAITDLIYDLDEQSKVGLTSPERESLSQYKLLQPILNIIGERGRVNGVTIQRELGMKSRSSLSNFLSRIRKYDLIHERKIGNEKIYFLSNKGEALLDSFKEKQGNEELSIENFLVVFLNNLEKELKKPTPRAMNVIAHANLECCGRKGIVNTVLIRESLAKIMREAKKTNGKIGFEDSYSVRDFANNAYKIESTYKPELTWGNMKISDTDAFAQGKYFRR